MRKIIALTAICSVVVLATWFASCKDKKSEARVPGVSDSAKKVLARGEYLAVTVAGCIDCHSKRDFTKFSGPVVPGTEGGGGMLFDEKLGLPGKIYARNITPDNETGIGTWSDDDIIKAMTQGINKNGDTLFPIMPYPHLNRMAKDDVQAIVAYLRTLKPIRNKIQPRQLMIPIASAYPAPILQPSIDGNVRPPESDKVKYGEYLVTMADCGTCHSPLTQHGPDMTRMFAGGYPFDMGTFKVTSPNITPDTATGIGSWNEAQFLQKFTQYKEEKSYNFNPGKDNTIMPSSLLAHLKEDDLKAIYAYLRSVKPISNKIEKYPQ
jgi:mono/diheme cytochrome c family protein